jgi:LysM repeat protein
MTERAVPLADGAPACPFVAFDDQRDDRSDRPDPRHRCYAESPPAPRARAHQEAYCLSANFPVCPTFQDWARREAARVLPVAGAGTPAERLRDVPAQREAGTRPPTFGAPETGMAAAAVDAVPGPAGSAPDAGADGSAGAADDDAPAPTPAPWDLPPRRATPPDWSAPPPWAQPGQPGAEPDAADVDAPDFLRSAPPPSPHDNDSEPFDPGVAAFGATAAAAGALGTSPAEREATMARLRAMGMGQVDDPPGVQDAPPGPRPVSGVTRPVDPADASIAAGAAAADASRSSSGGLAKLIGWDRRPKAGSGRTPRPPNNPAWERPRRYEAYPTLKTRVGLPMPSKVLLAFGALLVAAAILFFVPPMFLKSGGGAGSSPGASGPVASGASGAVGSSAPGASGKATPKPTAAGHTYTIKQGDTLGSIARKFGVTIPAILAANKQIKDPNKIAVGDVIVIPAAPPTTVVDGGASP